jgi:NAD(P)H-dependent flavin oxidoreductase YrpB (nitropropane dioxygenase family)
MIWASGWKLASAVSNAGGLGYILVSTFRKSHIGEQNEYHEVY